MVRFAFAANSNPGLVPNANIVLGGTGANRTLSVAAAGKKTGQAAITLHLADGKVTVPVIVTMVAGSDQSETLNGTSGADMMFGLSGQNIIKGNAGNDLLCGAMAATPSVAATVTTPLTAGTAATPLTAATATTSCAAAAATTR